MNKPFKIYLIFLLIIISFAILYVGGYFLLMQRNLPALNENYDISFKSSFRFAPNIPIKTESCTFFYAEESIFNWIFLPLDNWYYQLLSSKNTKNTLTPVLPKNTAEKIEK